MRQLKNDQPSDRRARGHWSRTCSLLPPLSALACLLVLAVVPLTASALNAEAQAEVDKGDTLFDEGDYENAIDAYMLAYELDPDPEILYLIGRAYKRSGNLEQAAQYLEQYLEESDNETRREEVIEEIIEIQMLETGDMALVYLVSVPKGAEIFFDDSPLAECNAPCERSLGIGEYSVTMRLDDYEEQTKEFSVEEIGVMTVRVELKPTVLDAELMVLGDFPGAVVQLDGEPQGYLPLDEPIKTEPGGYDIAVVDQNEPVWQGYVDLEGGSKTQIVLSKTSSIPSSTEGAEMGGDLDYFPWVVIGGGAVLAGVGLAFGLSSNGIYYDLDAQKSDGIIPDPDLIDQGETQALMANIFYGVGAAAVIAGVVWLLWPDSEPEQEDDFYKEYGASQSPLRFGIAPVGSEGISLSISGDL